LADRANFYAERANQHQDYGFVPDFGFPVDCDNRIYLAALENGFAKHFLGWHTQYFP
jgi:hypothetical protein